MAIKKAIYQVDNGTDFDEIYFKTDGSQVVLEDTGNNFTATTVEGAMAELFQNVSSGKSSIATAITDKGVAAVATDAFAILATKIRQISTGKKWASGTATRYIDSDANYYTRITISNLEFTPSVVIFYNQNMSSGVLSCSIVFNKLLGSVDTYPVSVSSAFYQSSSYGPLVTQLKLATATVPTGKQGIFAKEKIDIPLCNVSGLGSAFNWIAFE